MASVDQHAIARTRRAGKPTDARIKRVELYLLPVTTRLPLKFGSETLTTVTCARVRMTIVDRFGLTAEGWGETPLSVQWAWPAALTYSERQQAMVAFCRRLAEVWHEFDRWGHALEIGHAFQLDILSQLINEFNLEREPDAYMPHLAALVCCSAFDVALHDAYGMLHDAPVYETYTSQYMSSDLSDFLIPAQGAAIDFRDIYPSEFVKRSPERNLPVWHLVGGLDPLEADELPAVELLDGYPVLLGDWISRDGLYCLKVKLRGNDAAWDYNRLVRIGRIGQMHGVRWLSADFNCTVHEPQYVNDVLDRLAVDEPQIFDMISYVEQPFPYDLEAHRIDVHSVSQRKPLFLDESAHDWRFVALGRSLGWNGVALKTCKTQTSAILSLCWAQAHGMSLMVQDLTNPMLAQIPHVMLAAHAGTIMGVESNSMQFYPEASSYESRVHPGVYQRRDGQLDLATIKGPGFGYRVAEVGRPLPEPVCCFG